MAEKRTRRTRKRKPKQGRRNIRFLILLFIVALLGTGMGVARHYYLMVFGKNVYSRGDFLEFILPSNLDLDGVIKKLVNDSIIIDSASFRWVAEKMNYQNHIQPGKYYIKGGISNRELVSQLRSGAEEPVRLVIRPRIRFKEELAALVAGRLEVDSAALMILLNDPVFLRQYSLTPDNVMAIFIPDTYFFYWDTDATEFFDRMYREFQRFWNDQRKEKAKALGLTPIEVIILASIVEEETNMDDEKQTIAGVYLNRLRKGWKLQADPTLKFAHGDFTLRRILKKHTRLDSPYNTYMYKGLPPGPISLPSPVTIDAVLNAENHNYMYFCARADGSGYHHFSTNYRDHITYARQYHQKLNENKVYD